jgi:hypothetical protein
MHWLQSTFSTRFNRFRQERGHLFQGRYQALLVENMAALARVVDYIHLNPARAKIVAAERLADFRWSSLQRFLRGPRSSEMACKDGLGQRGLTDTPAGIKTYVEQLGTLAGDEAEQKRPGLEQLSKGRAIGTAGWCRAIAKDHAHRALDPGTQAAELQSLKETRWISVLDDELKRHKQTGETAISTRANAEWKISTAKQLRQVGAPYAWITDQLQMGATSTVRVYLNRIKK